MRSDFYSNRVDLLLLLLLPFHILGVIVYDEDRYFGTALPHIDIILA